MNYFLYELVNPIDNEVFYIGITNDPARRFYEHCQVNKKYFKTNYNKTLIVSKLKKQNLKPVMNVLFENIPETKIQNLENQMIDNMLLLGYPLTNIVKNSNTDTDRLSEINKKISKTLSGRKRPNKVCEKMAISFLKNKKAFEMYSNKDWLYNQYIIENKSARRISTELNVSSPVIDKWIRKFLLSKSLHEINKSKGKRQ